jgi:hypothetical protein
LRFFFLINLFEKDVKLSFRNVMINKVVVGECPKHWTSLLRYTNVIILYDESVYCHAVCIYLHFAFTVYQWVLRSEMYLCLTAILKLACT